MFADLVRGRHRNDGAVARRASSPARRMVCYRRVRTRGGERVAIEQNGMVDVALRELDARLISVDESADDPASTSV